MSQARFLVGDVFERMAEIPDGSIDCVVTSPPFLALRSYLPADHPDKGKEIGSEATPAEFLSTLLRLTVEWQRVLAPHGSICVELGDTYSGSGGAGGDYAEGGLRDGAPTFTGSARAKRMTVSARRDRAEVPRNETGGAGWPLAKSLCLIPTLYPASLAYGRNLLNPDDRCEPWRVRNLIVWHRPNPPVGALGDKVRPSTSYVTTACVSDRRWFDLDSERTPFKPAPAILQRHDAAGTPYDNGAKNRHADTEIRESGQSMQRMSGRLNTHDGAPPLDCWTIPTAPYAGAHYATFPPALPRRLINLMCPRQVCVVCGEPRRRIVEQTAEYAEFRAAKNAIGKAESGARGEAGMNGGGWSNLDDSAARGIKTETLGWSDCGHNTWRRGIVLDPFAGSGTTLQAASELGRDSIGFDLDSRNLELARERLGMFLEEEGVVA